MFAHLIGPPWTSQQSLAHWVLQKVRHVNLSFSDYAWSFKSHPPSHCFSPRLFTLPFSWGLELNFSSISSSRCLFLMLSRCETTLCWVSASFKSFSWKVIGEKVDKGGGVEKRKKADFRLNPTRSEILTVYTFSRTETRLQEYWDDSWNTEGNDWAKETRMKL